MAKCVVAALVMLSFTSGASIAQTISAEEKAIRDQIALLDGGKPLAYTEDSIFWSGAYKRPVVGQEKPVPTPVTENRVGPTKPQTTVRRIDVSQSGDMAYEFSDAQITVHEKASDGKLKPVTFPTSLLRVWKKVNGQWRVAAQFSRRHEE